MTCYKCETQREHPFHDNGTVHEPDVQAWVTGPHAFNRDTSISKSGDDDED